MRGFLKKLAIRFGKVLLALFLAFAAYMAYGFHADRSASRKAAAICASIAPGSDASSLLALAIADGANEFLTRWYSHEGFDTLPIIYIGMPPFSRYICYVKAKDGRVVSAKRKYLD